MPLLHIMLILFACYHLSLIGSFCASSVSENIVKGTPCPKLHNGGTHSATAISTRDKMPAVRILDNIYRKHSSPLFPHPFGRLLLLFSIHLRNGSQNHSDTGADAKPQNQIVQQGSQQYADCRAKADGRTYIPKAYHAALFFHKIHPPCILPETAAKMPAGSVNGKMIFISSHLVYAYQLTV
jgi:hypothetical protein